MPASDVNTIKSIRAVRPAARGAAPEVAIEVNSSREFPVREVTVRVRKLTAPIDGIAARPGVQMKRAR